PRRPLAVCRPPDVCPGGAPGRGRPRRRRLGAGGLFGTLNSDDPPMFGTTLTDEYRRAASVLGLSPAQLAELAAHGGRASFLEQGAQQALLAEIDAGAAGSGPGSRSGAGSGPRVGGASPARRGFPATH